MLYDIVPIPFRYKGGDTLDNILPLFNYNEEDMSDNIVWLGNQVPISDDITKNVFKYKTIELVNDKTIERVFMTTEPIDFKKQWWTSDIKIYPIHATSWEHHNPNSVRVNRYVQSINDMMSNISTSTCCPCTIEEKAIGYIKKAMPYHADNIKPNDTEIASASDYQNIRMLSQAIDIANNRRYFERGDYGEFQRFLKSVPEIERMFYDDTLTKPEVYLKDMKTIKRYDFGIPMCSVVMSSINTLFEIDKTVKYSEDNTDLKAIFFEICNGIEILPCTDLGLKISYLDNKNIDIWVEAYNRYMGYSDRLPKDPGFKNALDVIIKKLTKWQFKVLLNISPKASIVGIKIQKSWTNELFIETMYFENNKEKYLRYYVDLTMFNLGCISLMDKLN